MTRLRRIEHGERYFFVTTNLAKGVADLTAAERDLLLETVSKQRAKGAFFLFGYVAMPSHMHLLLSPRNQLLPRIMRDIKSVSGFAIANRRGLPGPVWQERYFDNIIRRVRNFWEKMEYIHTNPVKASLVRRPRDWKSSSHNFYARNGYVPIPLDQVDLPADGKYLLWPASYR
jgi:putative transposase